MTGCDSATSVVELDRIPSDGQLLRAIRSAVALSLPAVGGQAAAALGSADIALGVLLERAEPTHVSPPAPVGDSLAELVAWEAAQASTCLAGPLDAEPEDTADADELIGELDRHLPGGGMTQIESRGRISGGFSRETVALDVVKDGQRTALILRREQPAGLLAGIGLTLAQEYRLLRLLDDAHLPVGEPLWLEGEPRSGGPYVVSRYVTGEVLGTATGGTGIGPDELRALAELLAQLHTLAWRPAAETVLSALGVPGSADSRSDVVAGYLSAWDRYLDRHDVRMSPALVAVRDWLEQHIPVDDQAPSLIHGDVGFHNVLFRDGRIAALLDWEMAYLGSPAKDLAQIHDIVSTHLPWETFVGWYRDAGGEPIAERDLAYYKILAGYTYLLVCEVARQTMLSDPAPNIAYVNLAFPVRAHFYAELHRAVRHTSSPRSSQAHRHCGQHDPEHDRSTPG
jgi:aminoglycoside phosphotransferase (APT) family kinase protein